MCARWYGGLWHGAACLAFTGLAYSCCSLCSYFVGGLRVWVCWSCCAVPTTQHVGVQRARQTVLFPVKMLPVRRGVCAGEGCVGGRLLKKLSGNVGVCVVTNTSLGRVVVTQRNPRPKHVHVEQDSNGCFSLDNPRLLRRLLSSPIWPQLWPTDTFLRSTLTL